MFNKLPVIPVLVGNAVAAANAFTASSDLKAGRTTMRHQRSLYVKAGAILGGLGIMLVDSKANKYIEVSDALVVVGTALTTNELVFRLAQGSGVGAVAPQGYRQPVAAAPAAPGVQARAYRRQQVPGVFG